MPASESAPTQRPSSRPSPIRLARRLRLTNTIAATAFLIGGSLFATGAALAQAGVSTTACATIYLIGGAFFSTGGYASVLQVVNEPDDDGVGEGRAWRWWSREPRRLQWLSAVVLFSGTIVFAINLVDSFISELSPSMADRLVWSPDMVGCALFLVSGHLALVEIGGGRRFGAIATSAGGSSASTRSARPSSWSLPSPRS